MAASSDGKDKGCVDNKLTLWVGNLDKRLSEYNLLKILQRFGEIKSFDLHFHKSGAREGEPSYCFVEFKTFQEAENALLGLNGKLALSKPLSVNWARKQTGEAGKKEKDKAIPTTPSSSQSSLDSCDSKIRAIEAKLKLMESGHKNDLSSRGKHPLLVQSEQVRSHPYKKQERYSRGRGRHAR
ncbi:probable RNA-binding protein 18 [Stylophora pistillata]|uniref:Probable RNA-binding protein 18 n=1 Tax=Stylophora pistillata TaxID=50429 RepID=A0A2B4REQ5_STYPI|nr:probable RNA-binding protein 18 [Stylophora pistillata]PFX15279.1 putative RNA-binding protein 18 [Stylophora pistillata]